MTVWMSFLWANDLGLRPVARIARINSLLIVSRAPHDRNYKYFWPVDIPVGIGSVYWGQWRTQKIAKGGHFAATKS
jgi:hypothetical protein